MVGQDCDEGEKDEEMAEGESCFHVLCPRVKGKPSENLRKTSGQKCGASSSIANVCLFTFFLQKASLKHARLKFSCRFETK